MSWVNCDSCGMRHRLGTCPRGAPQRPSADRSGDEAGKAARALIDAANRAAIATVSHDRVITPAGRRGVTEEEVFAIASERRVAYTAATEALERYIKQVMKQIAGA